MEIQRPGPPPSDLELLDALEARARAVTTINARARGTSWLGGERVRATLNLLADRNGRLRFEAEVSPQGTVAVLTTNRAGEFAFLDVAKSLLHRGPACPSNVASLIRIRLSPREVAALLLGDVALPRAHIDRCRSAGPGSCGDVSWDSSAGADVLTLREGGAAGLRIRMRREAGRLMVLGAESPAQAPAWRARFEDFEPWRGVALPERILFAEGAGRFADGVEIRFKERALNEPLADGRFGIAPGEGTRMIDVGCEPGEGRPPEQP